MILRGDRFFSGWCRVRWTNDCPEDKKNSNAKQWALSHVSKFHQIVTLSPASFRGRNALKTGLRTARLQAVQKIGCGVTAAEMIKDAPFKAESLAGALVAAQNPLLREAASAARPTADYSGSVAAAQSAPVGRPGRAAAYAAESLAVFGSGGQ